MMNIVEPCEACGTRQWLLVRNNVHGLRVERCDLCSSETLTDDQAADLAEPFLTALLMRFDEGSVELREAQP